MSVLRLRALCVEKAQEVSLEGNKPFFIVLLLLTVAGANASPTATNDNTFVPTVQMASDTQAVIAPTEVVGPIDAKLANLGAEFLQPPASSAVLGNAQGNHVKPLPAVPAAIFMVLSGFLCVSLVKDRKLWLAALAGLLWAGQIGIQALPQLALRLSRRGHNQQQFSAELTYPYYLENSNRLRSDIEGTQYISLLHHLAGIPDRPVSFLPRIVVQGKLQQGRNTKYAIRNTNEAPQFAITHFSSYLIQATTCLASKAEQFIYFSPAFIFELIPRGPPLLA